MTTFASVVLVGFGVLAVTANWLLVIRWWTKRKHGSMVPFIGGVFASIGVAMVLDWRTAAVPLVLDPGTSWLIVGWPIVWASRRFRLRDRG